jgi:hypothetical protein
MNIKLVWTFLLFEKKLIWTFMLFERYLASTFMLFEGFFNTIFYSIWNLFKLIVMLLEHEKTPTFSVHITCRGFGTTLYLIYDK